MAFRFRRNGGEVDWFWLAGARCLEEARRELELLELTFFGELGNSALASELDFFFPSVFCSCFRLLDFRCLQKKIDESFFLCYYFSFRTDCYL